MPDVLPQDLYPLKTANAANGGAINYWLVIDPATGWVKCRMGPNGHSLTVTCKVQFANAFLWTAKMLGYSIPSNPGDGGLQRASPERVGWPLFPTLPQSQQGQLPYYCVETNLVKVYGNGFSTTDPGYLQQWTQQGVPQPNSNWNNWPYPFWSEWETTFAATDFNVYADTDSKWLGFNGGAKSEWNRFMTLRERAAAENEKTPGGQIFMDLGAGAGVGTDRYKPLWEVSTRRGMISRVEMKLLNVPIIPEAQLIAISGCVNTSDFTVQLPSLPSGGANVVVRSRTYPAGKLLFDTWEWNQVASVYGTWGFDLTYIFLARLDGRGFNEIWNVLGQAGGQKFPLVRGTTATNIFGPAFQSADFKQLFKFS
jgi:hypothetical protein